jgi:serine/threonine-protein kinase
MLGPYRIEKKVGEGGMGVVYRATHAQLDRTVALKVLDPQIADDRQTVARFFGEARTVNKIEHKNIIEISDFVVDHKCGIHYMVMEYLPGQSLFQLHQKEKRLPLNRCLLICQQVASALQATHEVGIVHRDLKPGNIFVVQRKDRQESVKVLDFGVAKLLDSLASNSTSGMQMYKTMPGTVLGTPTYMSPEQAVGKVVDHRSDIYSFGVILFELVTGRAPFVANSIGDLVISHAVKAPPRPGDLITPDTLPAPLEALILRCLAKKPEDRPHNMDVVHDELQAILAGASSEPTVPSQTAPSRMNVVAGPSMMMRYLLAAGLVFLATATGVYLLVTTF